MQLTDLALPHRPPLAPADQEDDNQEEDDDQEDDDQEEEEDSTGDWDGGLISGLFEALT